MVQKKRMKKIVIAPDSFKGTMSAPEVCAIITEGLKKHMPEAEIIPIPIADGGEGTVECFLTALQGNRIETPVQDAFGKEITGYYGRFGELAVVEMAAAAGMVTNERRDPMIASSYGVGQLIRHAVESGCSRVLLGLGGSCTNDAGAGMAAALGTKFYDKEGTEFIPAGGNLDEVVRIDNQEANSFLQQVSIDCMCDIESRLYGPEGAAFVFATQKGASPEQVRILDKNLRIFADRIRDGLGVDVSKLPGGAAAGGMGAGACAFLGARLCKGIETVCRQTDFDRKIEGCDLVITGEGKMDEQSLVGKAISGVAKRAAIAGVPVIAIVGAAEGDKQKLLAMGLNQIYETAPAGMDFATIKERCREDLSKAVEKMCEEL